MAVNRFFGPDNRDAAESLMSNPKGRYFMMSLLQDVLGEGLVDLGDAEAGLAKANLRTIIRNVLSATPENRRLLRIAEDERTSLTEEQGDA